MAKTSAVVRDEKRKKMIQSMLQSIAELKELGDLDGLQKLPKEQFTNSLEEPRRPPWTSTRIHAPLRP